MFLDEKKLIMSAKGNVIIYDLNNNLVFKTEIINFDRGNNILSSPTESVFETILIIILKLLDLNIKLMKIQSKLKIFT